MEEPYISFHHAALKIKWAEKLIGDLDREIEAFMERKPYTISLSPDPNGGGYLLQVALTELIPYEVPCLIGDICLNLRASGDFCWMGLHRSIDPDTEKKTLPISTDAKGLKTTAGKTFKGEALTKVTKLLVDRVKSYYDFQAGGSIIFADLNHLSNWQKHNMLVPAFAVTELGDNTIIKSNDGSTIRLGRAKVNGRVAGIGGSHAEMTYDSEPTVQVFIKLKYLGTHEPIFSTLVSFREQMIQTLKAFCETFPSPDNPTFN